MWYEADTFFDNTPQKGAFFEAAEVEVLENRDGNGPMLQAILAYALALDGQIDAATFHLQDAQTKAKADTNLPDFLRQYLAAIESCLIDMASPLCAPTAPLVLK
jgi:hypothetical protein